MSITEIVSIVLSSLLIVGGAAKWIVSRVDKKFENINKKFEDLDKKLENIDRSFEKTLEILHQHSDKLSKIEGRFEERDYYALRKTGTGEQK